MVYFCTPWLTLNKETKGQTMHLRLFIYLGFNIAFNTLYRSYHDGYLEGQRKPVHTVGQGSATCN